MTSPRRPGRSRPLPRGSAGRQLPKPTTHRPAGRLVPTAATRRRPPGASGGGSGSDRARMIAGGLAALAIAAVAFVFVAKPFDAKPTASPGASAVAGDCPTSQPAALPAGETRTVSIETPKGTFKIKVTGALSPIAAGNFVALAACGYYDGVVFHRVATLGDGTPFVIQGGDPTGQGSGGPGYTIKDEPVTATYKRGTVAMARTSAPDSQGSQFFVVLDDKDGSVLSAANTYAIFGEVVEGMDVVDAIYAAAEGVELPANPIPMTKVSVSTP
jgi:cyclophilin family peptidyl-prolyl cis-trans isomerase